MEEQKFKEWSKHVSVFAIDRLVDEGIVKKDDMEMAIDLAAEEIYIRLIMGDHLFL